MASRPLCTVNPRCASGPVPLALEEASARETPTLVSSPDPTPRKASPCAPHACSGAPHAARLGSISALPAALPADAQTPRAPTPRGCSHAGPRAVTHKAWLARPALPAPRRPARRLRTFPSYWGGGSVSAPGLAPRFIGEGPNRAPVGSWEEGYGAAHLKTGWLPGRGAGVGAQRP